MAKKMDSQSIISATLDGNQVDGEKLETRYVPLAIAAKYLPAFKWNKNPKKGDIGGLTSAVMQYGFIDEPKWDDNLNDGEGGLVYGNHRFIAVVQSMTELVRLGQPLPRGIPLAAQAGEWVDIAWNKGEPCIPVKFGVNSTSEEKAMAAALDHNSLTLSGGDFGPLDITTRLYDAQPLAELLEQITPIEEAIVLDGDALDSLLGSLNHQNGLGGGEGSTEEEEGEERKTGYFDQYPKAVVLDKEGEKMWQRISDIYGVKNATKIVQRMMEAVLGE